MFKIGQKVVCKNNLGCITELIKGKIYTVEDMESCPKCGKTALQLKETPNRFCIQGITECLNCGSTTKTNLTKDSYFAYRFEPLKYDLLDNKDIISELIEERADIEVPELVEN